MTNKLTNPYEGIEKQPKVDGIEPYIRVATTTSRDDIMTIRKVILEDGWRVAAINRLFKNIADYCRANNLTFADEPQLTEYILSVVDKSTATPKPAKKKKGLVCPTQP